jgi:hypothetical protein
MQGIAMAWMAKVFGNIYLTEKRGVASFDADDGRW